MPSEREELAAFRGVSLASFAPGVLKHALFAPLLPVLRRFSSKMVHDSEKGGNGLKTAFKSFFLFLHLFPDLFNPVPDGGKPGSPSLDRMPPPGRRWSRPVPRQGGSRSGHSASRPASGDN